ncbi:MULTISPECIES: hypothetical protein [Kitasatospora]|uniref:Uncharacterized protein n=1 Tax=Kitasatospora cystarginea TaxID=58350 RepID=A0ABN3EMV5_9ACTN
MTRPPELTTVEADLLGYLRAHAELYEHSAPGAVSWAYRSAYHLLLQHGRFFEPADLPTGIAPMTEKLCYGNASTTARRHPGLVYVEGFAAAGLGGASVVPLAHAWCAAADGTVVDPTWQDGWGQAYFGVPVVDPGRWPDPAAGGSVLDSFDLLRAGMPFQAFGDIGRRCP